MKIIRILTLIAVSIITINGMAQDTLFSNVLKKNINHFTVDNGFSGEGWDKIIQQSKESQYVLIGEDHFIHEVPVFTSALVEEVSFDNYICEVDPWTLEIIESKMTNLPAPELTNWKNENANELSFFQKEPEFDMLQRMVDKGINLIGLEQVGLISTTIIFEHLSTVGYKGNRNLYKQLKDSSLVYSRGFVQDQKPYFMRSDFFMAILEMLDYDNMLVEEARAIDAIKRSAEIYKTGSHSMRIKLMHENMFYYYGNHLKGKRNLFKFGANHPMKGESYLPIYDIGNTAHVMSQSEGGESLHILILPRSGEQAGFIDGKSKIDYSSGLYKSLMPFFNASHDEKWTVIDLNEMRRYLRKHRYNFEDSYLEKTIKGYDLMVVIPEATAAEPLGAN